MPNFYINQQDLDDGLVIYQNPSSNPTTETINKPLWWYVRIRLLNENRYIRKSLRTTDEKIARRKARAMYEDIRKDEYYGFVPNRISISDLAGLYIQTKVRLSEHRMRSIKRVVRLYLSEYFGDRTLTDIANDHHLLHGYLAWREGYWTRYKQRINTDPELKDKHDRVSKRGYTGLYDNETRTPVNIAESPSRATLRMEYALYNALMNFAVASKYIPSFIKMDYQSLPDEEPKYQAIYTFEKHEIKLIKDALVDELRQDRKPILDEHGRHLRDQFGKLRWDTFVSQPNARRCRHNLRALIILMLTTGMRVQECLDLTWSSISEGETVDDSGEPYKFLKIRVKETKSRRKSNRFRTAYAPYHLKPILGALKPINDPDINPKDRVINQAGNKRYGLLMRRFKQLLINLNIYESEEGAKRTLTHLRSYYASEQLQIQPLHIVAAQMGHSVQTLYDFYTQIAVGKRAYDILKHIKQPHNIVQIAKANHLSDSDY